MRSGDLPANALKSIVMTSWLISSASGKRTDNSAVKSRSISIRVRSHRLSHKGWVNAPLPGPISTTWSFCLISNDPIIFWMMPESTRKFCPNLFLARNTVRRRVQRHSELQPPSLNNPIARTLPGQKLYRDQQRCELLVGQGLC